LFELVDSLLLPQVLQKNLSTIQRPGIKRKREFELNFGALGDMENGEKEKMLLELLFLFLLLRDKN
jgi:hypothetical protein